MASKATLNSLRQSVVNGRRIERGYTVDSAQTKRRDDGFHIQKREDGGWIAKISIADVASVFKKGCKLDEEAKEVALRGRRNNYIPLNLATKVLSLEKKRLTPAVTYTIHLDKDFALEDYTIERTAFQPIASMTYRQLRKSDKRMHDLWQEFADGVDDRRFNKRMSGLKESFERAGASVNVNIGDFKPNRAGIVEQLQFLARYVTGDYLKNKGVAAFYVLHTPAVDIDHGPREEHVAFNGMLRDMIKGAYDDRDYNVDASSPIRRYDDLMMQRILTAVIEGRDVPYDGEDLRKMIGMSRYAGKRTQTLTLAFNENSYNPKTERYIKKGDTRDVKPVPQNLQKLTSLFNKLGADRPTLIKARIHHGSTRLSLDVAAVFDPLDKQLLGVGLSTKRNNAENLAVRDALVMAERKYADAAPS